MKVLSPNTVTLGAGASTYDLGWGGGHTNIQSVIQPDLVRLLAFESTHSLTALNMDTAFQNS